MAKKSKYEINKVCAYCEHAGCMNDPEKMLCALKGVVSSGFCCRKFIYDPLKRDPAPPVKLEKLSPEDLLL